MSTVTRQTACDLCTADDERHRKRLATWARLWRQPLDAYIGVCDAHVRALVRDADVYIRVTASALVAVLTTGRFENVIERKERGDAAVVLDLSRFLFDPLRRRAEREAHGIAWDAPGGERPLYAYLSRRADGGLRGPQSERLAIYGDIAVRLTEAVRGRTTFTLGDSLAAAWTVGGVTPLTQPSHRAALTLDPLTIPSVDSVTVPYVEAQIWGSVTTADIAEVIVSRQPHPRLVELLEAHKLPWRGVGGPPHQLPAPPGRMLEQALARGGRPWVVRPLF